MKCLDKRERARIMDNKGKEQFKKVWLERWQPLEERVLQYSFHAMFKTIGKENEYYVRGNSVSKKRGPQKQGAQAAAQ